MKTIAKIATCTCMAATALVVALPSPPARADGPTLRREPTPTPTARDAPPNGAPPSGVSIGDVKRHGSAAWSSGALEYDVTILNPGTEAVKTSLVLTHDGAPVTQLVSLQPRSKETVTIADPAGLTHCARSGFMLRVGSQTAPPVTVDVKSNCTFRTTTIGGRVDSSQEPGVLTYTSAHPTGETQCDRPLRFDATLVNNTVRPIVAQYGVKPPVGPTPWAVFETGDLGPHERRVESFASLPFRGDPGRYTVVLRERNNAVPSGQPGAGVDITRTCQPEVAEVRR